MSGKLTKADRRAVRRLTTAELAFIRFFADGRPATIRDFALLEGKSLSAASNLRNRCLEAGAVKQWRRYNDPVEVSDLGRTALSSTNPLPETRGGKT
jgi:hypothetical protein